MKKKIRFFQEHFCVDYETPDQYLLLIEVEDGIPVASYILKIPEPLFWCTLYPYVVN